MCDYIKKRPPSDQITCFISALRTTLYAFSTEKRIILTIHSSSDKLFISPFETLYFSRISLLFRSSPVFHKCSFRSIYFADHTVALEQAHLAYVTDSFSCNDNAFYYNTRKANQELKLHSIPLETAPGGM